MSRSNQNYKPQRQPNTLMESFGAVQAALEAMPIEAVKTTRNAADAFLLTDATLASIDKQRRDAESQYKKLVVQFGFDDPMVEAMQMQRAAIEEAYNTRLKALRRKREEQGRGTLTASNDDELKQGNTRKIAQQDNLRIKREEERQLQIRTDEQQKQKRRNDTLWLWAFLMLGLFDTRSYQQRRTLSLV